MSHFIYSKQTTVYKNGVIVSQTSKPFTWSEVRSRRDGQLVKTDVWALKDITMSQARKDYRQFLRDLPQNFETPDDAINAWNEYTRPE